MLKCPMCRDMLPDDMRKCRKCQTDLSLLSDYVTHLRAGLSQADALTKSGELGEAVWAYLAVLEVDPDNTTARRQVGKVVTAVRQFDQTAPGRRWLRYCSCCSSAASWGRITSATTRAGARRHRRSCRMRRRKRSRRRGSYRR